MSEYGDQTSIFGHLNLVGLMSDSRLLFPALSLPPTGVNIKSLAFWKI